MKFWPVMLHWLLEFDTMDKLALKHMDQNRHSEKSFKIDSMKENDDEKEKFKAKSNIVSTLAF